ncbi:MAG: polysaccharide biosynthesis C-terminal domain-containing protein [Phaeodactylibacter sp.]|nr:polysaccharide biosynthesis C-terminal domain-containing protein [Phaeodactylibacter sp.]
MGIILRQSFKQSIIRFGGIGIGLISTLFIYPLALQEMGVIRFIQNTAQVIVPFCLMGSHVVAIRFFPQFKTEEREKNSFFTLLLLWALAGFFLFMLLYWGFESSFLSFFQGQAETEYLGYFDYIPPMVFLMAFAMLITNYTSNFHRIVVPSIFNEFLLKITLPLFILLFFWQLVSLSWVIKGLMVSYLVILVGLVLYLVWLGQFKLGWTSGFLTRRRLRELGSFAGFNVLGSWGYILANRIDVLMLGLLLDADTKFLKVGVYTINLFISEVIDAPRKALFGISSPIVAEAAERGDRAHLLELYQKTALNQLLVGLGIFLLIWVSLDDLFSIMPNGDEVRLGRWIVLFLGIGKLIDMATGINGLIIQNTEYFRYNFYFTIILAVVNILNNLWLIPLMGFTGAAIATLISIIAFNLCKFFLLYVKMQLQPFGWANLLVLGIGAICYGIGLLIPTFGTDLLPAFASVLVRSTVVGGVFFGLAYYFKVSPDLNQAVHEGLAAIQQRFKR